MNRKETMKSLWETAKGNVSLVTIFPFKDGPHTINYDPIPPTIMPELKKLHVLNPSVGDSEIQFLLNMTKKDYITYKAKLEAEIRAEISDFSKEQIDSVVKIESHRNGFNEGYDEGYKAAIDSVKRELNRMNYD